MKKLTYLFLTLGLMFINQHIVAQVPSYVPTDGLVGWWPFTGNAIDSSGNANNGTVNGATLTADRFGNVNSAFIFDGVNDWININNSNSLNPPSQITISAWVNTLAYNVLDASMVVNKGWDQGPGHYDLLVSSSNNKSRFVIGSDIYVESNSIININQWTLITASIDSLTMKIYVNGTLENTVLQNNNNSFGTNTDPLYIGKHDYNNAPYYFNGKIDDIGIWNRVLTQQEITSLYTSSILGINEISQSNLFSVFPNPAKNQINIKADATLIGSVYTVFDNQGKIILRGKIISENTIVELENLSVGVYLLNVGENKKQTFKVIKE